MTFVAPHRRRSPVVLGLLVTLALAVLGAPSASAQSARERLARLQASPPEGIPEGAMLSIANLLDTADRIEPRHPVQAPRWRARAERYLSQLESGTDPFPRAKGEIVNRGYRSPISEVLQGYAIYLPPDYDPSRAYPLYIALHGGSSNGNLFLGVVLGNNMDWQAYDRHVYDDFTPRYMPDWIVVAPTGFGQILWRWMGERDVLDVIEDVKKHYSVDPDRVVLGGLSNGGLGAHAIGMRHAWRFSVVQAMAGAPSWVQYLGGMGRLRDAERVEVLRYSGLHLLENSWNTDYRYYHGRVDPGPMRPRYIEELDQEVARLGAPARGTWLDAGHDILYIVHRHGRHYANLTDIRRDRSPREVRVVSGDYRAARQHWVEITRFERYPELGRVRAVVGDDGHLEVETSNVRALALHVGDAPLGADTRVRIDGQEVYVGPKAALGHRWHVRREGDAWRAGFPSEPARAKRPGLSGPVTDTYYGRMVHVFGTQRAETTSTLERAAQRGARGWPLWSWDLRQEVVRDTDVTDALMREATLVLYGTPGDNAVLDRIAGALPIRVEDDAVVVGATRHAGRDVAARFVYPNPLAPERYVLVNTGVSAEAIAAGNGLPEFLPDYAIYDRRSLSGRQDRVQGRSRMLAQGYFDHLWRLPGAPRAEAEGAGPDQGGPATDATGATPQTLPVPPAPPVPGPPARFAAPANDPAGRAARRIWGRVPTFQNFRAEIPGATWRTGRQYVWSIGPERECHEALREKGVRFRAHSPPNAFVASPVEILGPIDGVWFRMLHEEDPFLVSCELALRLPELVASWKRHGVRGVEVMSSWRSHPYTSFHTMGLALDLPRFWTDEGWLSVLEHYEETPLRETCAGPDPRDPRARTLRRMACDMAESGLLSSVLTPNYNAGHRDHFHVDIRPDDPRMFLR
ncbi:MAG: extensin family protein [Myxococcales bacterium]|nr:extensin family protein [Myxococcales bacterium]